MLVLLTACLIHSVTFCNSMSPKIVGGIYPNITKFPHSASLDLKCVNEDGVAYFACGASIVNQEVVMTAAHCLYGCSSRSFFLVSVGHCSNKKGNQYIAFSYTVHSDYHAGCTANDIALVRLRVPLVFSSTVSRVALMRHPPYKEKAQMAGWGVHSAIDRSCSEYIKSLDQYVWKNKQCRKYINTPPGTICASSGVDGDYAAVGDSGSALVVHGYIQIGLVSYKKPSVSLNLIVYTDIGYFYDWIITNVEILVCTDHNEDQDDD